MRTALLALLLPLQACILYDGDCREDRDCPDGPDDTADDGRPDDDPADDTADDPADDTDDDTGYEPPPWAFVLQPSEAEAGDVFIASLRFEGDTAPAYDTVTSLEFFGDVDIWASDIRSREILLTLAVPAAAPQGTADLLVRFQDVQAAWGEDVLAIWPAGSGHEAGSSDWDPCDE